MIPSAFDYHRASSIEDAVDALRAGGDQARPLAGGQSLIAMMRLRFASPGLLVDLGAVPGLRDVDRSGSGDGATVSVGAMVNHHSVGREVAALVGSGAIADVGRNIADQQVRNIGTLAGALAHADPSGDWQPVALAHGFTIGLHDGNNERRVDAADFFLGPFTTAARPDEIITRVVVPIADRASSSSFVKIADPASGYARVAACCILDPAGRHRLAVSGAATTAVTMSNVEQLLADGVDDLRPGDIDDAADADLDAKGSAADPYRRQLIRVAVRRAIGHAVERQTEARP